MENYRADLHQKNWNDMKAAVGAMVASEKNGNRKLTLDELLLNVKAVSFDDLVCQTQIKSEDDKNFYSQKGYHYLLTEDEFKEKFSVDPSCIWYTPSISQVCIYFNEKTMAACPFPVDFLAMGIFPDAKGIYRAIGSREEDAQKNEYFGSVFTLPDAMRLQYIERLVEKKGSDIPGLYELFSSIYVDTDYGFGNISANALKMILDSRTDEDREKTREKIMELPDRVKVYRGGNSASTPFQEAFSWTLDINVANFFACRRGSGEGHIIEAEVSRDDIIEAFLDNRNEQEVIIDPDNLKVTNRIEIRSFDSWKDILPEIIPMYQEFVGQMKTLEFTQDSDEHGFDHQAKVLLHSLALAKMRNLPLRDMKVLAAAAVYHDTQRVNDIDDSVHGNAAKEYYLTTVKDPDPLVAFLCEYHCLPDTDGHKEIMNNRKLSKNRSRAKLLYDIFKDADALDRVRFGIRALDINQLRLPESKELTLAARLVHENIRISGKPKLRKPSLSGLIQSASSRAAEVHPSVDPKTIVQEN